MFTFKKYLIEKVDCPKIYLDLDGVLVAFNQKLKKIGVHLNDADISDIENWSTIKQKYPDFWVTLNLSKEGSELWDFTKKYHPCILSAVPHNEFALWGKEGKMEWIENNLDMNLIDEIYLVERSHKKDFAVDEHTGKPNLLIDDYEKNCIEFEQNGGYAIHHKNFQNTLSHLKTFGFK